MKFLAFCLRTQRPPLPLDPPAFHCWKTLWKQRRSNQSTLHKKLNPEQTSFRCVLSSNLSSSKFLQRSDVWSVFFVRAVCRITIHPVAWDCASCCCGTPDQSRLPPQGTHSPFFQFNTPFNNSLQILTGEEKLWELHVIFYSNDVRLPDPPFTTDLSEERLSFTSKFFSFCWVSMKDQELIKFQPFSLGMDSSHERIRKSKQRVFGIRQSYKKKIPEHFENF